MSPQWRAMSSSGVVPGRPLSMLLSGSVLASATFSLLVRGLGVGVLLLSPRYPVRPLRLPRPQPSPWKSSNTRFLGAVVPLTVLAAFVTLGRNARFPTCGGAPAAPPWLPLPRPSASLPCRPPSRALSTPPTRFGNRVSGFTGADGAVPMVKPRRRFLASSRVRVCGTPLIGASVLLSPCSMAGTPKPMLCWVPPVGLSCVCVLLGWGWGCRHSLRNVSFS